MNWIQGHIQVFPWCKSWRWYGTRILMFWSSRTGDVVLLRHCWILMIVAWDAKRIVVHAFLMFFNGTLLPNFGAFLIFFNAGGGRHWHSFLGRRHLRQFMIAVDIYSEMLVNDITCPHLLWPPRSPAHLICAAPTALASVFMLSQRWSAGLTHVAPTALDFGIIRLLHACKECRF